MMKKLCSPVIYASLALIALSALVFSGLWPFTFLDSDLRKNLVSEFVGALVSIVIIDRILSFRNKLRDDGIHDLAVQKLGDPLRIYIAFWYTVAQLKRNLNSTSGVREVVTGDAFLNAVIAANWSERNGTLTRYNRLIQLRKLFREALSRILTTYGAHLSLTEIQQMDWFLSDTPIDLQIELGGLLPNPTSNFFLRGVEREVLRSYFEHVATLVDLHNTKAALRLDDANILNSKRPPENWTSEKERTQVMLDSITPELFKQLVFGDSESKAEENPPPSSES